MNRRSHPVVWIIILNYRRPALTIRLLESCQHLDYPAFQLLVVDNGSGDGSCQQITTAFTEVQLLCLQQNLGFAAGVNVGLRQALAKGAEYVLLLNNDTLLAPDMLGQLLGQAEQRQAAVTAPVICYEEQPEIIWSAGAFAQPLTSDIWGKRQGERYTPQPPHWVDYAPACALLIKGQLLQEVGLFDERYFMYYEDLEWCWRLKRFSQKILIVPQARMWHRVAATSGGTGSASERYYMARSSVLFFRQHTRGWRWLIVAPFRFASALRTSLRLGRRPAALRAYWRGLWHGMRAPAGRRGASLV